MIERYTCLDFLGYEQGSEDWFSARAASLDSSEYKTAVTTGRGSGPSKTRQAMLERKVRAIMTGVHETCGWCPTQKKKEVLSC